MGWGGRGVNKTPLISNTKDFQTPKIDITHLDRINVAQSFEHSNLIHICWAWETNLCKGKVWRFFCSFA